MNAKEHEHLTPNQQEIYDTLTETVKEFYNAGAFSTLTEALQYQQSLVFARAHDTEPASQSSQKSYPTPSNEKAQALSLGDHEINAYRLRHLSVLINLQLATSEEVTNLSKSDFLMARKLGNVPKVFLQSSQS